MFKRVLAGAKLFEYADVAPENHSRFYSYEVALVLQTQRSGKGRQWEAEPLSEAAAKLDEQAVGSVAFNPCANRPGTGDWLSMMRENVAAFDTAMGLTSR